MQIMYSLFYVIANKTRGKCPGIDYFFGISSMYLLSLCGAASSSIRKALAMSA